MSDADKKKLFIAIGLLIVAGGLLAWYMFGSAGGKADELPSEAAPVVQTKDGPPAAANRRMPPSAK